MIIHISHTLTNSTLRVDLLFLPLIHTYVSHFEDYHLSSAYRVKHISSAIKQFKGTGTHIVIESIKNLAI